MKMKMKLYKKCRTLLIKIKMKMKLYKNYKKKMINLIIYKIIQKTSNRLQKLQNKKNKKINKILIIHDKN